MAIAVPRYTVQDLYSFPDDGNRYELLDGVLLVTPAPAQRHQLVVFRLMEILLEYLRPTGAIVYSPGSVEIEPSVHLEPDILVVPKTEPMSGGWSDLRNWWLAVGVSGRGSKVYDRDFKFAAYSALGVRDVWRVDLQDRCMVVRSGDGDEVEHRESFSWRPEGLAKPVAIDVASLFADLGRD